MTGGYYPDTKITDRDGDYLAINTDGSINVNAAFAAGSTTKINDGTDTLLINADGSLNVTDNGGSLTVDGTVAGTGNFINKPYTPAAADILCGGVTVTNSAAATTIITIPANRVWYGNLGLNCVEITGGAVSTFRTAVITTTSTATPAAGTILCKNTVHQGPTPDGTKDASYPGTSTVSWIYIAAGASNSDVTFTLSAAATTFSGNAWANGVLL